MKGLPPVGCQPCTVSSSVAKLISILLGTYSINRSILLVAFAGNVYCLSPKSKLEHLENISNLFICFYETRAVKNYCCHRYVSYLLGEGDQH